MRAAFVVVAIAVGVWNVWRVARDEDPGIWSGLVLPVAVFYALALGSLWTF